MSIGPYLSLRGRPLRAGGTTAAPRSFVVRFVVFRSRPWKSLTGSDPTRPFSPPRARDVCIPEGWSSSDPSPSSGASFDEEPRRPNPRGPVGGKDKVPQFRLPSCCFCRRHTPVPPFGVRSEVGLRGGSRGSLVLGCPSARRPPPPRDSTYSCTPADLSGSDPCFTFSRSLPREPSRSQRSISPFPS